MLDTTIHNRYTLDARIGSGAMGDVYRAKDEQSGDLVAVKAIKADLLGATSDLLARFEREGEALRELNHPNIVKLQDVIHEDAGHYLVMEYVSGGDLSTLLNKAGGKLPVKQVLEITLDLADALTRAHRLDIIHRDLKPANVLIAEDGTPRLSDFGIALTTGQDRLTDSKAFVGTMDYIAPEVINGRGIDTRGDIWSFGVMLFEMLAGQRPFRGEPLVSLLSSILNDPVPDLESLRPDCPTDLADLVYRMLDKDVMARIPSVRHVGAELEDILIGRSKPDSQSRFSEVSTERLIQLHSNLPAQTTPFIGRTDELETLGRLIGDTGQRLITILGPGGMGKSRLSIEVGSRHAGAFRDGVFFVELAKLTDADNIPAAIAEAVRYAFTNDDPPREQIINFLGNKQMLLMLDNFEHLIDGHDLVSEILHSAAEITVLTTSRTRLNLSDEVVVTLDGMDFPDWETPEDALQYSAVQLFMSVAQRVNPDFELEQADLDTLIRICRLVEGMPLGITLAGAWLDTLTLAEIVEEIARNVDFLESEMADLPDRQRSMRAVFDYSWALLSDEEREAYARMSVLRGSCTRKAAQQISGASLRMLNTLVNKSLLRRDPDSGRFHIHELLRQIAEEYLEASGAADTIRDAHSIYYLDALAGYEADLKGRDQLGGLDAIEADFENIRAAWQWAVEQDQFDHIRSGLIPLSLFAQMRSRKDDCQTLFDLVRELPDDPYFVFLASELAQLHKVPDLETVNRLKDIAALYETQGQTLLAGLAYLTASWRLSILLGQRISEDDSHHRALALFRKAGDDFFAGWALTEVAGNYFVVGQRDQVIQYSDECEAVQRSVGDKYGLIRTLNNAATNRATDWADAERRFLEVYDLASELKSGTNVIWPLVNAALTSMFARGDRTTAEERLKNALHLGERNRSPRNIAYASAILAWVRAIDGEYDDAQIDLDRAKANYLDPQVAVKYSVNLAGSLIWCGLNNVQEARTYYVPHLEQTVGFVQSPYRFVILPTTIWMLIQNGRAEFAAELMGHLMSAPERPAGWLARDVLVKRMQQELSVTLGTDSYQAALERGQDLDLMQVLHDLYSEIESDRQSD